MSRRRQPRDCTILGRCLSGATCCICGVRLEEAHSPEGSTRPYCLADCPACAPLPSDAEIEQAIATHTEKPQATPAGTFSARNRMDLRTN
jgi:hypothetical protein